MIRGCSGAALAVAAAVPLWPDCRCCFRCLAYWRGKIMEQYDAVIIGIALFICGNLLMHLLGGAKLGNRLALSERSQALLSDAATVLLFSVALATTFYEGEHFAGIARVLGVGFAVFSFGVNAAYCSDYRRCGSDSTAAAGEVLINVLQNSWAPIVMKGWAALC